MHLQDKYRGRKWKEKRAKIGLQFFTGYKDISRTNRKINQKT